MPEGLDDAHIKNFLECVRSREAPNTEVEIGHKSTIVSHLGNVAYRAGRSVKWEPKTETISGDPEASALLGRTYRKPYTLPVI